MIRVLFWNVAKKDLSEHIAEIVNNFGVDIIATVEDDTAPGFLTHRLALAKAGSFAESPQTTARGIRILARMPPDCVKLVSDQRRISIRSIHPPGAESLTLVVTHGPSKLHRTEDDQAEWIKGSLVPFIEEAETRIGHQRTLLVGDLNINPFERSMIAARGLHAVSSRAVAARNSRIVDGQSSDFFYNPMWSCFGDRQEPAGTFFRSESSHHEFFWHMLDQVLIRPSLLGSFSNEHLQILTHTGDRSLVNSNGEPDKSMASDHLPLHFRIG